MIRRGVLGDAAALAEIGERTFVETFAAVNRAEDMAAFLPRTYGETHQRRELEDPRIVTLIVECEGVIAGFAQLRRGEAPECVPAVDPIEIQRFYVDRAWHGRGIAQSLMRECENVARSAGAATIWLGVWEHNARAIAFYAKCGFRVVGSQPFLLGSDLQTDRIMVRGLRE